MFSIDGVIDALADHLRFERELGARFVELSADLRAQLRAAADRNAPASRARVANPHRTAVASSSREVPSVSGQPTSDRGGALSRIAREISDCDNCALHRSRKHAVPGQGHPCPEILFVGEGPGAEEDRQGLAFVGPAGQLLTKMIAAMGFTRDEVFIANIVKCRPSENRNPEPEEMNACLPFLQRQIDILRPRVIVCLGNVAARGLLSATVGITRLRGRWTRFGAIPVMPTYHPSYLLRYPAAKKQAWEDLQNVLRHLDKPVPPSGSK